MELNQNIQKHQIYVKTLNNTGSTKGYVFAYPDGSIHLNPQYDFYLNIFLTRTTEIDEYVDTQKDDTTHTIERQNINPYFIEFGFFDSISRVKVNDGSQLTSAMIEYIKAIKPETLDMSIAEIRSWFNNIGINEFSKKQADSIDTILDELAKLEILWDSIVSKAEYYPITINK